MFEKWALTNGYKVGLTLDRINIDGNYNKFNCEWVTRAENTRRQVLSYGYNLGFLHSRKRVLCIEDDICFDSVSDAAQYVGGSTSNICKVLSGKNRSMYGRTWRYVN